MDGLRPVLALAFTAVAAPMLKTSAVGDGFAVGGQTVERTQFEHLRKRLGVARACSRSFQANEQQV